MGLAMSPAFVSAVPSTVMLLGGRQSARTLHFLVSVSLVAFLLAANTGSDPRPLAPVRSSQMRAKRSTAEHGPIAPGSESKTAWTSSPVRRRSRSSQAESECTLRESAKAVLPTDVDRKRFFDGIVFV